MQSLNLLVRQSPVGDGPQGSPDVTASSEPSRDPLTGRSSTGADLLRPETNLAYGLVGVAIGDRERVSDAGGEAVVLPLQVDRYILRGTADGHYRDEWDQRIVGYRGDEVAVTGLEGA
jgi:hypothetical protein